MPVAPIVIGLGAGLLLAFAVSGCMYKFLADARKTENGALPFLLLFWIVIVALFAILFPLVLEGRVF